MIQLAEKASSLAFVQALRDRSSAIVERMDGLLANTGAWVLALIGLAVLQLALIFHHQPWLDEWQALQIAIQSPTLADLLENLRYEGHPPLWYLLLRAGGVVLDPFMVLPTVAAVLALSSQATIAFACPFSRAERLLLGTGAFLLFEFMTLSRSLTLGVAVMVITVSVWRRRWVWLGIALLPMCDFLFGALSGILLLLQWRDKRLWWPGVASWLVSAVLAGWSVRPAADMIAAAEPHSIVTDFAGWVGRSGLLLMPLQWGSTAPQWNGEAPLLLGGALGIAFFMFASTQLRSGRLTQILFWGFVGLTLIFSLAVYPLSSRHLMLIALLLILLVWRGAAQGVMPSAGFRAWLLVSSGCGLFVAAWSFVVPFDTAEAAGREIVQRGLANKHWMVFPESRAQGVSALTGMEFERTEARCMQSFIRWNFRSNIKNPAQLTAYLRHEIATRGRFYLLSDLPLATVIPRDVLLPITYIPPGYDGYGFYLFVAGSSHKDISKSPPHCVPNQRPLRMSYVR